MPTVTENILLDVGVEGILPESGVEQYICWSNILLLCAMCVDKKKGSSSSGRRPMSVHKWVYVARPYSLHLLNSVWASTSVSCSQRKIFNISMPRLGEFSLNCFWEIELLVWVWMEMWWLVAKSVKKNELRNLRTMNMKGRARFSMSSLINFQFIKFIIIMKDSLVSHHLGPGATIPTTQTTSKKQILWTWKKMNEVHYYFVYIDRSGWMCAPFVAGIMIVAYKCLHWLLSLRSYYTIIMFLWH